MEVDFLICNMNFNSGHLIIQQLHFKHFTKYLNYHQLCFDVDKNLQTAKSPGSGLFKVVFNIFGGCDPAAVFCVRFS